MLILLLDGLYEVMREHRNACVEAINQFRRSYGLTNIVICSRSEEYNTLMTQLNLHGAIQLQPLTMEQIDDYLSNVSNAVEINIHALKQAIHEDDIAKNFAKSPLMLNMMIFAYQDMTADDMQNPGTLEERRNQLFEKYTERMLERGGSQKPYTNQQTKHWLSWLAQKMTQYHKTVFFIDEFQPSWLGSSRQQQVYELILTLGSGLAFLLGVVVWDLLYY